MREIKFRGKRIDNGKWIQGLLLKNKLATYIITEENPHECTQYGYLTIEQYGRVHPESVGQYAGLKDKHGKEIYEGDQLYAPGNLTDELEYIGQVIWDEDDARWEIVNFHGGFEFIPNQEVVVKGNIYDHSHLLNKEEAK